MIQVICGDCFRVSEFIEGLHEYIVCPCGRTITKHQVTQARNKQFCSEIARNMSEAIFATTIHLFSGIRYHNA